MTNSPGVSIAGTVSVFPTPGTMFPWFAINVGDTKFAGINPPLFLLITFLLERFCKAVLLPPALIISLSIIGLIEASKVIDPCDGSSEIVFALFVFFSDLSFFFISESILDSSALFSVVEIFLPLNAASIILSYLPILFPDRLRTIKSLISKDP